MVLHPARPVPVEARFRTAPLTAAVTCALVLGVLTLLAAFGVLGAAGTPTNTLSTVLRSVLGAEGACCLAGAVLLVLRQPAGRALAAMGGGVASALPLLMVPLIVVTPEEFASGIRQSGGLLMLLALFVLGPLTMVLSLRCGPRAAVARHHPHGPIAPTPPW